MESHLTIDRRLASHRDRYEPPESPPNTLLLAYEDRRFNKMARQLKDSHDELKSKILVELIQDLVNGNKIVLAAMTSEMIEVLVEHLEYSNDEIREMASKAIAQFCKIMKPRELSLSTSTLLRSRRGLTTTWRKSERMLMLPCWLCRG
jgi:hypothetical protein